MLSQTSATALGQELCQVLKVENVHDDGSFFILYGHHIHQAAEARSCGQPGAQGRLGIPVQLGLLTLRARIETPTQGLSWPLPCSVTEKKPAQLQRSHGQWWELTKVTEQGTLISDILVLLRHQGWRLEKNKGTSLLPLPTYKRS